jgi:hypothetical protein
VHYLLNQYFRRVERVKRRQKAPRARRPVPFEEEISTRPHSTADPGFDKLQDQFEYLPRSLMLVFRAIRVTTRIVGPGKPILVVECRIMSRGVLVPHPGAGEVCGDCGLYGRGDRSCAGWYHLGELGASYLSGGR